MTIENSEFVNPEINTQQNNVPTFDEPTIDDGLSGEEDLFAALKSLNESELDDDPEESPDLTDNQEDEEIDEVEDEKEVPDTTPTDDKKVQSKEDNAKFAAERRQKELDDRVQAELARVRDESPEFKLAKQLSEMYNVTPDVLMEQMRDAKLAEEARQRGLPVEILKERESDRQRVAQVEQELNNLRYASWNAKIDSEGLKLQDQYKMLDDNDLAQAKNYILTVAKNVDLPLEDAVFAVHGKKIIDGLTKAKVQEDLASQSGRAKKTPLAPTNGKPSTVTTLSADEEYIRKQFGMTAEEYQKYK